MKVNNDAQAQMKEELGESLTPGASTAAALKFGLISARIDKNFWRQVKRPTWYNETDEKGRDLWQQKKMEVLAEVNKIIRRQLKEQSRQQGFQNRPGLSGVVRQATRPLYQWLPKATESKVNYGPLRDKYQKPS
jgi:hypothetical protein